MRTFLLKGKKPICKWGSIPQETYFQGEIPEGYSLAINPSKGTIIIDVDRHGDKNGFDNIPEHLLHELDSTLNYLTKNNGKHFWFYYTGNEDLGNKASGFGIDLRTSKGYCVFYLGNDKLKDNLKLIKKSSKELNKWLEKLFCFKHEQV